MAKRIVLGKGIASLINDNSNQILTETLKNHFTEEKENVLDNGVLLIDISEIIVNPNQPRKIFKEKELDELAISIKENGIIQPLIVRKSEGKGFELIAGERRYRAAKKIALEKVPVLIKQVTDKEKMVMSIIENVQRSDLNCVEEALAYFQLMDDFRLTQEELAQKVGKERSTVANFLRILKLPRQILELVQKDVISFGHAKLLAGISSNDAIIRYANMCVAKEWSVKDLENMIKKGTNGLRDFKSNKFFDEKIDQLKNSLEKRTGFHFEIKNKKNDSGQFLIKYGNEAEFNDIYEFLLK